MRCALLDTRTTHPLTPVRPSPQEGIDAVSDVIAHIETYDVTTIRCAGLRPLLLSALVRSHA